MNAPASRDSVYAYPRTGWISLLNRAPRAALMRHWQALQLDPAYDWIRKPEFGLVMLRGRVGGVGAKFNLGEATVTRCALKLRSTEPDSRDATIVGLGMALGRDAERVRTAALLDALLQDQVRFDDILNRVLRPLEQAVQDERESRAGAAAATKVEFFTMVRGE
jgi:alpha-D-ribose 1-methylphosphonate 5-triphosphate synthase subunit PhnG